MMLRPYLSGSIGELVKHGYCLHPVRHIKCDVDMLGSSGLVLEPDTCQKGGID